MLSNAPKHAVKAVLYLALNSNENYKMAVVKDIAGPLLWHKLL